MKGRFFAAELAFDLSRDTPRLEFEREETTRFFEQTKALFIAALREQPLARALIELPRFKIPSGRGQDLREAARYRAKPCGACLEG